MALLAIGVIIESFQFSKRVATKLSQYAEKLIRIHTGTLSSEILAGRAATLVSPRHIHRVRVQRYRRLTVTNDDLWAELDFSVHGQILNALCADVGRIIVVISGDTNYAPRHKSAYFANSLPKNSSVAPYALIQLFHSRKS